MSETEWVANNQTEFEEAINRAKAAGGGTIKLGPGKFKGEIPPNTHIDGSGRTKTIFRPTNSPWDAPSPARPPTLIKTGDKCR